MKNKKWILLTVTLLVVIVLAFATSYALFRINVTKNTNFKLAVGTLELTIIDTETEDKYIMESTVPMKDDVALSNDGYTFTIKNTGNIDSYYTVYLDDIMLTDAGNRLDNKYVKLNLFNHESNGGITNELVNYSDTDRMLTSGYLKSGEAITYTLRMWVDYNTGNEAQNKYFATQIRVVGTQQNAVVYTENILNGADPVLTDNLIPVIIADDGTVTKASVNEKWYSYQDKKWANAVILKNNNVYKNGEVIPENSIESYFVWIPKYSYQLWDLGKYNSLTSIEAKEKLINVKFGLTNTDNSITGECTTPGVAGESGSCDVGEYMTHPAFLAFNTNGLWVGKFDTGYDGATSSVSAQVNSYDSSKIIIKPNVYIWRNNIVGNMFKASFDYSRKNESHMMKNTEWGAVTYLQYSKYGSAINVRINNNSDYISGYASTEDPTLGYKPQSVYGNRYESVSPSTDGTYTINYLNSSSTEASTTGNYTGIYDMSGGAWNYVAGYNMISSTVGGLGEITSLYNDFFTNSIYNKYYDKYSSIDYTNYDNRILGDATGELGPFALDENIRYKSSWYEDFANFTTPTTPWFERGGYWHSGLFAGIFAFAYDNGGGNTYTSFRVVLAPSK